MVVAFHAGLPVPGGFVGVDVFFVISGFVITSMLRREWLETGRIRFGRFYLRRFQRLTPALALMVTTTVLVAALAMSPLGPQQTTALTALGAMFMLANVVIARITGDYFGPTAEDNPLLNTWSLSVEEQFYLAFPALIAVGWYLAGRSRLGRWAPVALVSVVAIASFYLACLGSTGTNGLAGNKVLGFYSPFTRAWEFAVGALLALATSHLAQSAGRTMRLAGVAGVLMLGASLWVINGATPFPGPWTLVPVAATLLILISGASGEGPVPRLLSTHPFVKVGDWSYSIYLWHWPFIVFATLIWPTLPGVAVLAAAASFTPALVSYRWLETPVRRLRSLPPWRASILIGTTLAVPVLLAGSLGLAARNLWGLETLETTWAATRSMHLGEADCMAQGVDAERCTWNSTGSNPPLYLVGDSNAAMYSEAALEAARSFGRPLQIAATADCPFIDAYLSGGATPEELCREDYVSTLEFLKAAPDGTVLLATSTKYAYLPQFLVGSSAGDLRAEESDRISTLGSGLQKTVAELKAAGHSVILIAPTYRLDQPPNSLDLARCSTWAWLRGGCSEEVRVSDAPEAQSALRGAVVEVATESDVGILDLADVQCPNARCSQNLGSLPMYRDVGHFSVAFVERLGPLFVGAIRDRT